MTVSTFNVAASADDATAYRDGLTVYPPDTTTLFTATATNWPPERTKSGAGNFFVSVARCRWDTSSLPDGDTVDSAIFRLYVSGKSNIDSRSFSAGYMSTLPDAADYTPTAEAGAIANVAIASITSGADNDFTLLDVAANISKTGYSGLRAHISGGEPTGVNYVDAVSWDHATLTEPRLIVTHTVPDVSYVSAVLPFGGMQPVQVPTEVVAY